MFAEKKEIESYEFEQFRLEVAMRRLLGRNNKVISLPPKSFDILLLLVQNSGELLTKDELMNKVWSEQIVEENNLTVRIAALRKALGESRGENVFIQTIPSLGYRFVAKVTKNIKTNIIEDKESPVYLVVLPFLNESNDPNLDYICDGVTEGIINNLSQLEQIKVISRNTAFRYKEEDLNVRRVGQDLNVQVVLIGRLYKIEKQLVISTELINVEDESQIWGVQYSHSLTNLFELQGIIAKEVSTSLRLHLNLNDKERLTKRYTHDPEAYLSYLKGRYLWNKRSIKDINKAIEYFQEAVERDPNYGLAYTGLADCHILLTECGVLSAKDGILNAEQAVTKALEIDDSLAEAHTSLASIRGNYHRDWLIAESEYKLALKLNPNYVPARYRFASHLAKFERFDEALFHIRQVQKIDPLSPIVNKIKAKVLYLARRYDEAISIGLEILEVEPDFGPAHGILAGVYLEKQMYREALHQIQKLINFSAGDYKLPKNNSKKHSSQFEKQLIFSEADPEAIAICGYIYAITGKKHKALRIVEGLKEMSKIRYVEQSAIALVYTGLGDKDQAFEWLEKAYADSCVTITYLKVWSLFDSLRSDPRFDDLLERLGLKTR
jgi:TolB-like protein